MKKLNQNKVVLAFVFIILIFCSSVHSQRRIKDYCYSLRPAKATIAGSPIKVLNIERTGEFRKYGKIYYTFKLIVKRPSKDNGTGVANVKGWGNLRFRYFISVPGYTDFDLFYSNIKVSQHKHRTNNRLIILHLQEGLPVSKSVKIRVGFFPYPMVGKSDFQTVIKGYKWANFLKTLNDLRKLNFIPTPYDGMVWSWDKLCNEYVNHRSEHLKLEVMPKMPVILKKREADAKKLLKERRLIPQPGPTIKTSNPNLHGKIAIHRFTPGQYLHVNTNVPYKVYEYKTKIKKSGWVGTWAVRSFHKTGPARGGRFNSKFTVTLTSSGSYVVWNNDRWKCTISGNTLRFTGKHQSGGKLNWTFVRKGNVLISGQSTFRGTISGKSAWGTYEGRKISN